MIAFTHDFMKTITDWIIAIGTAVTAAGIWYLKEQVKLLWLQMKYDHERSRRSLAVELATKWSEHLHHKASLTRKLVETLPEQQARNFFHKQPVHVPIDKKDMIVACLDPHSVLNEQNGSILLSVEQVANLNWLIVCYLNLLESILAAYRHGIADPDIIREEFSYLVAPDAGHYILKHFRTAAGGAKCYPAIEQFVQEVQSRLEAGRGKSPIATQET